MTKRLVVNVLFFQIIQKLTQTLMPFANTSYRMPIGMPITFFKLNMDFIKYFKKARYNKALIKP